VTRRLHILDGFAVAFLNLDEVIRIIRPRGVEPKPVLMKRFRLSDEQTEGDPQHNVCATWRSSKR